MLLIQDKVYLDILIDGQAIPATTNMLHEVILTEGNGDMSPVIQMTLNDQNGSLQQSLALTDGNEIAVVIGRKPNDTRNIVRQYRLFGTKQTVSASGPAITAYGIYDAPGYLTGSYREAYEGSSTQVLQALAQKCMLTLDGPKEFNGRETQDRQVWLNVCSTRANFVHEVIRHAYMDDNSAMSCALTSAGVLKYRNLLDVMSLDRDKIQFALLLNIPKSGDIRAPNIMLARQVRDWSAAGLMTNWVNYGSTRAIHSLTGEQDIEKSIDLKTTASFLPINEEVSRTVGNARIDYACLDCGNVHSKYERAAYQNIRLLALFSERLSVLLNDVSNVQLYDAILYYQQDNQPSLTSKNSAVYIVVGKTIMIRNGNQYIERLELARPELTVKGSATLKGASGADASLQPNVQINTNTTSVNNKQAVQNINNSVRQMQNTFPNYSDPLGQTQRTSTMTQIGHNLNQAFGSLPMTRSGFSANSLDSLALLTNAASLANADQAGLIARCAQLLGIFTQLQDQTAGMPPVVARDIMLRDPQPTLILSQAYAGYAQHAPVTNALTNAAYGMSSYGMTDITYPTMPQDIPRYPGYNNIPGAVGTGGVAINGFPGNGIPDFLGTVTYPNIPAMPPYPGLGTAIPPNNNLPGLPLDNTVSNLILENIAGSRQLQSSLISLTNSFVSLFYQQAQRPEDNTTKFGQCLAIDYPDNKEHQKYIEDQFLGKSVPTWVVDSPVIQADTSPINDTNLTRIVNTVTLNAQINVAQIERNVAITQNWS